MIAVEESRDGSNLFAFSLDPLNNSLVGTFLKPALLSSLLVVFISGAEPLRAKVESVAKGFVDAAQDIIPGHEDLGRRGISEMIFHLGVGTYPLKGSAARPRVRSYKDRLCRHVCRVLDDVLSIFQGTVLDNSSIFQEKLLRTVPGLLSVFQNNR